VGARTPTAALLAPRPPVAQRGPGAPSRPPCRDAYCEQSIRRRQEPTVGESSAKPRIPAQRAAHNPRADPLEALDRARRTRFPCPCQTPASSRARFPRGPSPLNGRRPASRRSVGARCALQRRRRSQRRRWRGWRAPGAGRYGPPWAIPSSQPRIAGLYRTVHETIVKGSEREMAFRPCASRTAMLTA
jgi:hypothetical protein